MKRILVSAAMTLALGSLSSHAAVTGQWDFNNANLAATVGADLAYFGDTETVTTFQNVTIDGSSAAVMRFPAATASQGFVMTHGIAPNGGGAYVNQYTLIMDIMFPTESSGAWRSLFQTSTGNLNDGDFFINPDNGIGISASYHGVIQPDTWHRVAFVFDLSQSTQRLRKYIDGLQVGTQDLAQEGSVDGRWSLDPTVLILTDDTAETKAGFVNSIQIHDVPLTASDIFALGKATAAGIPSTIPVLTNLTVEVTPTNQANVAGMAGTHFTAATVGSGTITYKWLRDGVAVPGQTNAILRFSNVQLSDAGNYTVVVNNGLHNVTSAPPVVLTVSAPQPALVTGQWDFNQGDLRATFGSPLQYFDATVQNEVQFGKTTTFGISDIAGQEANVMFLNPSAAGTGPWGGLVLSHGISPNGGGTNVNQYTVIMDVLYPLWTSSFYRALWQTQVTNTNDADIFINGLNGLGISSIYNGELSLDQWHRIVLTFDLTRRELGKYIDGTNVLSAAVGTAPFGPNDQQYLSEGVDMRWSLGPSALLFADEDGEVQPVYVSSIQVRNGRMTDAAIAVLGAPTASKIPGAIKAARSGNSIVIDWTGTVLESATAIGGPWTPIQGAAHPYDAGVPAGTKFFRVRQ